MQTYRGPKQGKPGRNRNFSQGTVLVSRHYWFVKQCWLVNITGLYRVQVSEKYRFLPQRFNLIESLLCYIHVCIIYFSLIIIGMIQPKKLLLFTVSFSKFVRHFLLSQMKNFGLKMMLRVSTWRSKRSKCNFFSKKGLLGGLFYPKGVILPFPNMTRIFLKTCG